MSLKTGEPEGRMQQPQWHHIPARILSQMQFIAGSGGDEDGDSLPDLYEDLVTRNDPLSGATGDTGVEDAYQDPDSDGWLNAQEYQNGTDPFAWNQPPGPSAVNVNDFHYDVKLEVRKMNPPSEYQALQEDLRLLFPPLQRDTPTTNLQIRITVEMPEKKPPPRHGGGP